VARRCWSCTNSIPRGKLSTVPSPGWRVGCPRRSRNWTSFSSPWARAWDGHEVVDLAVGRLALHYAEENPDEVVAALDNKTEAVIRELEAQIASVPNSSSGYGEVISERSPSDLGRLLPVDPLRTCRFALITEFDSANLADARQLIIMTRCRLLRRSAIGNLD